MSRLLHLAVGLVVLAGGLAGGAAQESTSGKVRNVILVVGDGMGPAQVGLGLHYAREIQGKKLNMQALMEQGNTGYAIPVPFERVVTDSAAAASQIASGVLARNETLGMDAEGRHVETILEWAESRGMVTGLVTNTRITHGTPGGFAAHQLSRYAPEEAIANDIFGAHDIEVLLGGGGRALVPRGTRLSATLLGLPAEADGESRRTDDRNLLEEARSRGYALADNRASLQKSSADAAKLLGIFAASHLPYVVDRDRERLEMPTLPEMTEAGLSVLRRLGKPFFLLVEGGRIDHAAHDNDAGTMLHELLELDETVGLVLRFQREHPETLVVVTADHGTGGFSFTYGREEEPPEILLPSGGIYQSSWSYPGKDELRILARQTSSYEEMLARAGLDLVKLREEVWSHTGLELTWSEASRVLSRNDDGHAVTHDFTEFYRDWESSPMALLGRALARHTFVVWSTGGHTSDLIPTFGSGPGAERLRGIYPNTHLYTVMKEELEGLSASRYARPR